MVCALSLVAPLHAPALAALCDTTSTVSVSSSPVTSVSVFGHSLDCGNASTAGTTTYSKTMQQGSTFSVTAPKTHQDYAFMRWEINGQFLTASQRIDLTVTGDMSLTAVYGHELLLDPSGTHGVLTVVGYGSCHTDQFYCTVVLPHNSTATVFPSPDSGSSFSRWEGDCASFEWNQDCTLTMSTSHTAGGRFFAGNLWITTVAKSGTGVGTVTDTYGLINCGSDCQDRNSEAMIYELVATPSPGSRFVGWSENCTGSDGHCYYSPRTNKTITARFDLTSAASPTPTPSPTSAPTHSPSPSATPTQTPGSSPSPSPSASVEPGPEARSVTLSLRKHIVAVGQIQASSRRCYRSVAIRIQRRTSTGWKTVSRTTSGDAGRYRSRLADRRGTYRAVVRSTSRCLAARSPRRRHTH